MSWKGSRQVVFSGDSPTSWQDIDLSAIVGAKSTLVFLKVKLDDYLDGYIFFRTNGDTDQRDDRNSCCTLFLEDTPEAGYVILQTDAAGIIEWEAGVNTAIEITLMGYLA